MESLTRAQQELYDWLVDYIRTSQHAPSIRQMMKAMSLKSPAPIQSRLERLRKKGYITWDEGKARTIRITYAPDRPGIQIMGVITAGGLVEPFTDVQNQQEELDLQGVMDQPNCFALRVTGDSMIGDMITEGDFVLLRQPQEDQTPKDGAIVAVRVEGEGTTLKRYYQSGNQVTLKASNPNYDPIQTTANQVQIQGVLVGVWRTYGAGLPMMARG
ncbi:transcriptional repressor LexA [Spirulina major CS-329]|jgi:repressor LexA|uniref:transcriptional repressor LexA n=1 Tax=Spirulina TaxID=1154 RepID=UPI0009336A9C|nr:MULTISPECIES: transcriptional repressor LexA [Spirulina]MDB9494827.1 transcriptional repressor LexA [Spirulina subsalsa CS-330]MDB9502920.1 transcriptional repressor LexA [Spirulina major CS-329]